MSAIIESFIEDTSLVDYWIEKGVFRVGRGSDCDCRIDHADVPEHLGTVRFRNGQYVFYNRGGSDLTIGDRVAESGSSETWHANEIMTVTPEVSMRLVVDGDPAPSARPDNAMLESYQQKRREERRLKSVQDEEAQKEIANAAKADRAARSNSGGGLAMVASMLAVTLLLLAGVFAWLISTSGQPDQPVFNPLRVAKSLLKHSADLPPQLVTLLQETQQSVELGDSKLGKTRLLRLQAELERLKADGVVLTVTQGDTQVGYEDALRAYINAYLAQLGG